MLPASTALQTLPRAQVSLLNTTVFNITRGNTPAPDLVVTSEISSLPSGNGLILQGNGLTVFTGANTYDGGTSVTGGTLQLNNNAALGTGGLAVSAGIWSMSTAPARRLAS